MKQHRDNAKDPARPSYLEPQPVSLMERFDSALDKAEEEDKKSGTNTQGLIVILPALALSAIATMVFTFEVGENVFLTSAVCALAFSHYRRLRKRWWFWATLLALFLAHAPLWFYLRMPDPHIYRAAFLVAMLADLGVYYWVIWFMRRLNIKIEEKRHASGHHGAS